jgi:hypothetical protein|tara:strand:+ start:1903 stop:2109 length:207 start_codon:yes stop_codon:yes gene_type:complete
MAKVEVFKNLYIPQRYEFMNNNLNTNNVTNNNLNTNNQDNSLYYFKKILEKNKINILKKNKLNKYFLK